MNPHFKSLMDRATQLTQAGRLQDATTALLSALGGGAAPASSMPTPPTPGKPSEVIDVEARVVSRDVPPATSTSSTADTGRSVSEGRFLSGRHTEAGLSRDYKLFVPPQAAEPGRALPLVVMLHGCTQNPDDFAAGTQMNAQALAQGFLVLYPAQAQQANSSGCWNWFKHNHQARGKGEPAVIAGMVRAVMAAHSVDPARIFVAGLSAGGAMAAIVGSAYPELFAAVGVHSGLAVGAARDVSSAFMAMKSGAPGTQAAGAPPTIVFHGDQDATVHPDNGAQVLAASLRGTGASETREAGRGHSRSVWRTADGAAQAEHWVVHGAGHAWSGGDARGNYTAPTGPDATAEMLRFFMAQGAKGDGRAQPQ